MGEGSSGQGPERPEIPLDATADSPPSGEPFPDAAGTPHGGQPSDHLAGRMQPPERDLGETSPEAEDDAPPESTREQAVRAGAEHDIDEEKISFWAEMKEKEALDEGDRLRVQQSLKEENLTQDEARERLQHWKIDPAEQEELIKAANLKEKRQEEELTEKEKNENQQIASQIEGELDGAQEIVKNSNLPEEQKFVVEEELNKFRDKFTKGVEKYGKRALLVLLLTILAYLYALNVAGKMVPKK